MELAKRTLVRTAGSERLPRMLRKLDEFFVDFHGRRPRRKAASILQPAHAKDVIGGNW